MNSLRNNAYKIIIQKIVSGEYVCGKIYTTVEVAKDLEMSRTPVREALIRLAAENYVIEIKSAGFMIVEMTIQMAKDISELFMYLEVASIDAIQRRNVLPNIDELKKSIAEQLRLIKQDKFLEYYKENLNFHQMIISAMGNNEMLRIYMKYADQIIRIGIMTGSSQRQQLDTIEEHSEMVKSLEAGDYDKVKRNIGKHYTNAIDRLIFS